MQVDPGQMQFLMSTAALPMVAKPVYGIISDSVYIKGAHRVPYLIIAGEIMQLHLFCVVLKLSMLVKIHSMKKNKKLLMHMELILFCTFYYFQAHFNCSLGQP